MSGSSFGKIFKITTWGESHGQSLGVIVDGCPSGIELSNEDIKKYLNLRKPSNNIHSTKRIEQDNPIILSGIFNGLTTGTPIAIHINNSNQNSNDYEKIKDIFRPSHADYTYFKKYENVDFRGGGRSSGRETVSRVIAGAIANKILSKLNIEVLSYVESIGEINVENLDLNFSNEFNFPDKTKYKTLVDYITKISHEKNSVGGRIKTVIKNLPVGLGEPVFDKLDALLSYALFGIGGVKAVEIGCGTKSSDMLGSEYNDQIEYADKVNFISNNSGGILGGISNGDIVEIRTSFKPTPSISIQQNTISKKYKNTQISIDGRHDICYVPRANIVVTSMVNLVIVDLLLQNTSSKIDNLIKVYNK